MSTADQAPRVILLHGLWMSGMAMHWFARRMREAGFAPEVMGYRSIFGGPEPALERLRERLRGGGPVMLVGHSLGGLIALRLLGDVPQPAVRRVVCLGTPVSGSGAARALSQRAVTALYLGRSGGMLRRGCADWPQDVQVGMIAGNLARGLGGLVARLDGPHDGTVAVAETRAPGLSDHVVVPAGHSGLLFSPEAVAQTAAFLRDGRFGHAEPSGDAV